MKGANEYADIFTVNEQVGRLVLIPGMHARGKTFRIFVLPKGEQAIFNGPNNAPLNEDAVEVYGVVSGNPGWTEEYGWKFGGIWQEDFEALLNKRRSVLEGTEQRLEDQAMQRKQDALRRSFRLLNTYKRSIFD